MTTNVPVPTAAELTAAGLGWPDLLRGPYPQFLHGDVLLEEIEKDLSGVELIMPQACSGVGQAVAVFRALVRSLCAIDPGVLHSKGDVTGPHAGFAPWSVADVDDDVDEQLIYDLTLFVPLLSGWFTPVRAQLRIDVEAECCVRVDVVAGEPDTADAREMLWRLVRSVLASGDELPA